MKKKIKKDPHSYAELSKVNVIHLDIELTPDFKSKTLLGVVELTLDWHDQGSDSLILDTKNLKIEHIEILHPDGHWHTTDFKLEKEDKILGSALHIKAKAHNKRVRITYQTSSEADGLQWLDPSQTATKQFPYLYSHSQPINVRTWLPVQDTPAVRQTYTARINTPQALRAVMSAENDPNHALNGKFEFNMAQAIPSYLIAFAIGNITAKEIGPRSAVFAEPNLVSNAAKEFEDTEKMIQTAENLYGKYLWDNFNILVMPPSFPMGGMENPRLTFATPTLIAGDKSLVNVIAHELAHSWSGNLVTNAKWEDIWLNEGFTTYVQNRIVEKIYSKEQANQEFIVNINNLYEEIQSISEPDQRLVPDLEGRDPRSGMTKVAYIKGAWFLKTLEEKFGRDLFDAFLKQYFTTFAFQSITSADFEIFLKHNLIDPHPDKYSMEEVKQWMYQPGIPKDAVIFESNQFKTITITLEQWLNKKISVVELNANQWSSNEWLYFLNKLPKNLTSTQLKELDDCYRLTGMSNQVIAAQWYKVALNSNYSEANKEIATYLLTIGRRYLIVPLYDKLLKTDEGKLLAQKIYKEARPTYHSITRAAIDKKFQDNNLGLPCEQAPAQKLEIIALNRYSHFNASSSQEENRTIISKNNSNHCVL
ncbi:M1 family metallopeptidase [Legionella gresilensis]|uniref:M1 family metallopeptidase n=1 Tax=Legionella gresilensis TaxID=91823 RepID=UPI00104182FC|nr:M1 family metallopeptidase [Legionella gresilensis]